ncbi:MAG: sensor histidine kinase [Spirochaetales bacterium]|nr:sensor histidine kinase [Spirochaetales bacterium]
MKRPEFVYRITVYLLTALAHGVAFLQFRSAAQSLFLPPRWHLQMLFLLILSLGISTAILFVKKSALVWGMLCLRALILLIAGMPMGENLMLEFTLVTTLILQTMTHTPLWGNAVFSTLLVVVVVLFQRPISVFGTTLAPASNFDLVSFCLYSVISIAICVLLRLFWERYKASQEFQKMLDEATLQLVQTNMELQDFAARSEQEATESERKRLAREVHDALGYTLTNLVMMMDAGVALAGKGDANLPAHLERARDLAQEGLAEVRKTLQEIRKVETLPVTGLKAVYRLVKSFDKATHIRLKLNLGDAPWTLGPKKDQIMYRLVQEGISNALRHGNATEISISFACEDGGVSLSIVDNGIGFQEIKEGYGLLGMRERVAQVGGRTSIQGRPREGTRLTAWIPTDAEA